MVSLNGLVISLEEAWTVENGVKIWVLDPLWWSYRETLPIVWGFILNEYYNASF